jgi:plastocyanin
MGDAPSGNVTIAAVVVETTQGTLNPGQSVQFTAAAVDASGNQLSNAGSASWLSSAASVATVSGSGVVRAVAPGGTSINATIGNVTGSRLVTVVPPGVGAIVTMPGLSFAPFTVTIKRTESVYFEFPQIPHNVIFTPKAGVPQDIQELRNATVSRQFNSTGTFPYDCVLHPGMKGEVIVNP